MSGPVLGAIITSAVALVVAIGGAVRAVVSDALDRRYERRRAFLIEVQDAMLVLREALDAYGAALNHDVSDDLSDNAVLSAESHGTTSFAYGVADATNHQVRTAQGRLDIARSRVEDDQVVEALIRWQEASRVSLISDRDLRTAAEESAFAHVNALIGAALRSGRATVRKRPRSSRR